MRLYLLLLCSFWLGLLSAQQPGRYLTIGPGWSYPTVLDKATSPLRYRGHTFLLSGSLEWNKARRMEQIHFLGWMGYIRPATNPGLSGASSFFLRGDLRWTNQYRLAASQDTSRTFLLGWGLLTNGIYRLHNTFVNNDETFEYFNSVSLESTLRQPFRLWGRTFEARAGFSLPLLSLSVYPLYNRGRPEGYLEEPDDDFKAIRKSLRVVSWGTYFRLSTHMSLDYHLKKGNALRLSYLWDYFHFAKEQPVSSGLQGLYLSMLFNF